MPRTRQDILTEINTAANGYQELSELQANTSKVAFWKAIKDVVSFAILTLETLFEKHKAEVAEIVNTTEIGSRAWYIGEVLKYQHGDILVVDDNILVYKNIDPAKQVVKKVSVVEGSNAGELIFKVLKTNNGLLTTDEMAGLRSYLAQKKILGTKIELRSQAADLVKFNITTELSSQVFAADGKRLSDQKEVVKDTITQYLAKMPFDGVFYVSRLEDALQSIEGVTDVAVTDAQYRNSAGAWTAIPRKYEPVSGWLTTDFTNTQIRYESV